MIVMARVVIIRIVIVRFVRRMFVRHATLAVNVTVLEFARFGPTHGMNLDCVLEHFSGAFMVEINRHPITLERHDTRR